MTELKEVFVRAKQIDEAKQLAEALKQYESETQFLMAPKSRDMMSSSTPEGQSKIVFTDSDSCDEFKGFGVCEFPFPEDESTPSRGRRDLFRRMFKGSERDSVSSKEKTQVKFSDAGEMDDEITYLSDVSITESIPIRNIRNFSPRLSYVKERPSSNQKAMLAVSENIIRLSMNQEVEVSCVDNDDDTQNWEVDRDFNIMQILKPLIKTRPVTTKIEKTQTIPIELDKADDDNTSQRSSLRNEERCCEFVSPIAAAHLFVTDTINNAKEAYHRIISMYGDPDRWSVYSSLKPQKVSSRWPQIKHFTKESGLYSIENYIVSCSRFREDWKYTILFEDVKDDNVSDHYYYEVVFGLPNRLYPIPQVTASLYFHVEVSRIVPPQCPVKIQFNTEISGYQIDPENYILKDNVLLRILDMKLLYFKSICF